MGNLFYNISQVLGITLINSLWQGLLVYLLVRLFLIGFPSASSNKKYNILYAALSILALWFAYTFYTEAQNYSWVANANLPYTHLNYNYLLPHNSSASALRTTPSSQSFFYNYRHAMQVYLPYISALYLISVVINLVRLAMAWQNIRHIKKHTTVAGALQQQVNNLAGQMAIIKRVTLSFSDLVDMPCAIGYIKPILLFPVSISTQLSADEIEVILLHELAHIKNNDYLLNLIQQVMALVLFFNPFAQLIDRMINRERENRCDDIVLELGGDPLTYAETLVKLEKTRQGNLRLALAATDNKYHLFARIQRIMQTPKPVVNIKHLILAMIIFIGSLGSIAWLDPQIKNGKITSVRGAKAISQLTAAVKQVIAHDIPPHVAEKVEHDEGHTNKIDTVQIASSTVKDSIKKYNERIVLVAEYKRLSNELLNDHYNLDHLREQLQFLAAKKILDSVRENKEKAALTPELKQEIKDRNDLWDQYFISPEVLKKKAEQQRLLRAYGEELRRQPEFIAFEKIYAIKKDSVRQRIMQLNGLTEDQLAQNEEYIKWMRFSSLERSTLAMKLAVLPKIKLLLDSAEAAGNAMYSGPVYDALNKKTHASKALMEVSSPAGLEKYKDDFKASRDKLENTAEWKKYQEDGKRYDEIVQKLKQTR